MYKEHQDADQLRGYKTMSQAVDWVVSCAVGLLIPKGSCSLDRWLSFDFEATTPKDESGPFTWTAQYCAPSGYIKWRTLLPTGVPHTELADNMSWYHRRAAWVPVAELAEGDQRATIHGLPVVAPGFVIANGSHDSCWRDNATRLQGYPYVQDGTWKTDQGVEVPNMFPTVHYQIYHDTTVKVLGISVKGPTSEGGWTDPASVQKYKAYTDGEWKNDTNLTGAWALLYGMSKLSKTVGKEDLDLRLDVTFSRGVYGKKSYKQVRRMLHYRFREGHVVCRGVTMKNEWFLNHWGEEVTPYLLDQERLERDLGIFDQKNPWTLNHLFPEVH